MANYLNNDAKGVRSDSENDESVRQRFDKDVSENKRYKKLLGEFTTYQKMMTQVSKSESVKRLEEQLKSEELSAAEKVKIEEDLKRVREELHRQAMDATLTYTQNMYKKATVQRKAEMKREQAETLAKDRANLKEKYNQEWAAAQGDSAKRRALTIQYHKDNAKLIEAESKAKEEARKLERSETYKQFDNIKEKAKDFKKDKSFKNAVELGVSIGKINTKAIEKFASEAKKNYEKADKRQEDAQNRLDELIAEGASEKELEEARKELELAKDARNEAAKDKVLGAELERLTNALTSSFEEVESMITDYKGHIDARLQGSEKNYNDISNLISTNVSVSPFVKTQKVLENMRELVDKGVAYNVEQRAFLQTVSDKIANTFDAFDSNLLRLIRLQQADTTAARLGMEASLTKFLNGMFQDTSYLSDMYDSVSAAIIDANASMTRDMSAQFEFIVQKWLGSLGSVGMSQDTINQIATGLNYLATGDVTNLANNTQLQTLMAMSASKAGLSYSDMLIKGLDASSTNKLLEGMLSYLKDIAENSDNQVVRAAYGDVFNLSISDMKAISNLSKSDISSISKQSLSYSDMQSELGNQFSKLITRTSFSEMMNNIYNNAVFGVAEDLISNPVSYAMYKMLHYMGEQEVDINIPAISIMGNSFDPNATVGELLNMGLQIGGAMSLIGNIFGGLGSKGGLDLDNWKAQEYTSRGSANAFTTGASQGDTTLTQYVSNGNVSDIKNSTINKAADDGEETREITNKNVKVEHTFDDFYAVTVAGNEGSGWVRVQDTHIAKVFHNTGDDYLHTRDSRMKFTETSLRTYDTNLIRVFGSNNLIRDSKWLNVYDNHLTEFTLKGARSSMLSVFDNAIDQYGYDSNTLSVHDDSMSGVFSRFTFTSNSDLKVNVSNMPTVPTSSGIANAIVNQTLKVKSGQTNGILVDINSASRAAIKSSSTVSVASMPKMDVTIDYARLATEIVKALGAKSTDTNAPIRTIGDLYELFCNTDGDDGNAHVRIENENGQRIQVDTESSSSGYAFNAGANNSLIW